MQIKRTVLASPGKNSLWRNKWSWREGWWTSAVNSTLERSLRRPNQRNLRLKPTPSRHASAPVAPPQTPLHHPHHPHPQTQATQTPAECWTVSLLRGRVRNPGSFSSHWMDWTIVELLTTEPQDGSDETSTNWPTQLVKPRKREMGLSLRSAHSSRPAHRKPEDGCERRRLSVKSCWSLENRPRWVERGTLHLL